MYQRARELAWAFLPRKYQDKGELPLTTDFPAWFPGTAISAFGALFILARYAFHTAVAGRPVQGWLPGTLIDCMATSPLVEDGDARIS
jgi:hypothetical protein